MRRSVVRGPPSVQQLQQARTAASVRTDALIVSKQERARRSRRGTAEPRTQAHFISGSIECLTSSPPSSSPLFCPRPAARGAFIMTAIRCAAALYVLAHGDQQSRFRGPIFASLRTAQKHPQRQTHLGITTCSWRTRPTETLQQPLIVRCRNRNVRRPPLYEQSMHARIDVNGS